MTKDAPISIRFPADLRAELQKMAEKDRRTLSGYVLKVLAEHVSRKK